MNVLIRTNNSSNIMKSIIILKGYFILIFVITATNACDPAEEGQPYELRHVMTKIPSDTLMVLWTKEDILIAECAFSTGNCVHNDIDWLTARVEKTDEQIVFSLNITSVSRQIQNNAKGIWKLRTHNSSPRIEVFYYCNLQVYANPTETKCSKTYSKQGLTVSCKGKNVYPEAMMSVMRVSMVSNRISCKNTRSTHEPIYYETECNRTFEMQELHVKKEDLTFRVYPNIIGYQDYNHIGTNVTVSFLIEPSSISVQDCSKTTGSINCSCERLYGDISSRFNWYANDVVVKQTSSFYTSATSAGKAEDITCKLIANEVHQIRDADNIAAIVLAILFVAAVLVIMVMCYKYIKLCEPIRDVSQSTLNKIHVPNFRKNRKVKETTNNDDEIASLTFDEERHESNKKSIETSSGLISSPSQQAEENQDTVSDNANEGFISNEIGFDPSIYNHKYSILLIGTKGSNKELFKKSLLQQPYYIQKEHKNWTIYDWKTKTVLHKTSDDIVKLPDNKTLHVHFSERHDTVFKFVDGPVYRKKHLDTFIEEMKSCLVLCCEGFNAVAVVYTTKKEKNAKALIDLLNDTFAFNMNNIILIKSNDAKYKEFKPTHAYDYFKYAESNQMHMNLKNTKDATEFEKSFGERYIPFYPLETYMDNNGFYSLLQLMNKAISKPFIINDSEILNVKTKLETVLREISLFMEIISNRTINNVNENKKGKAQHSETKEGEAEETDTVEKETKNRETELRETKDRLNHLEKNVWENYLQYNVDKSGLKKEIFEDVTYLIHCLQQVYFVAQPIKRNQDKLLPDVRECFQNFVRWFVETSINEKDKLLDINFKMKLSRFSKKRK